MTTTDYNIRLERNLKTVPLSFKYQSRSNFKTLDEVAKDEARASLYSGDAGWLDLSGMNRKTA